MKIKEVPADFYCLQCGGHFGAWEAWMNHMPCVPGDLVMIGVVQAVLITTGKSVHDTPSNKTIMVPHCQPHGVGEGT